MENYTGPVFAAEAFGVKDKVAIITGAGGYIGSGIAEVFAVNGAKIICSDLPGERFSGKVKALQSRGFSVLQQPADLKNPAELKALVQAAEKKFGRLDCLINCGGIPQSARIDKETDDAFDRLLHTNLRSAWLLSRDGRELMAKTAANQQGSASIVNIASINAHWATFRCSLYAASKAGLLAMTRELSAELAPSNIRVNSVSPGLIARFHERVAFLANSLREPFNQQLKDKFIPQLDRCAETSQPLSLAGAPADVAFACLYLCSPAARFVTGADLLVDGGMLNTFGHDGEQITADTFNQMREWLLELPPDVWKEPRPQWLERKPG